MAKKKDKHDKDKDKHKEKSKKDKSAHHKSDKHKDDQHKSKKHKVDKHNNDKSKDEKHKDEKHKEEKHKDDKHKVKQKGASADAAALKAKARKESLEESWEVSEIQLEAEHKEQAEDTKSALAEENKLDTKNPDSADATEQEEELHPPEIITSIMLVRHGHTDATERGLLYSDPQIPLTEKGIKQSELAAAWASKFKPDVIITGKALRVAQAAEPLAKLCDLTPIVVQGFEEWHVGEWEGRTYLDIKKNDPDHYNAWCADPVNNAPPGGESIDDLVQRIGRSLHALILNEKYRGKKIAMVTHSGIIRSILVHALDMPVSNFWRLSIPTGSVSRVNFSKNFALVQFCGVVPEATA